MALTWTMDKVGPIARTVEDCALVFQAIAGPDGRDATVVDRSFDWSARPDARKLRLGYVPAMFDAEPEKGQEESRSHERAALEVLRKLGFELVAVELPKLPVEALALILTAEAGAAFDELTRSGRVREMVRQSADSWPNVFAPPLHPAVEYLRRIGFGPSWRGSGRRQCTAWMPWCRRPSVATSCSPPT
jgi:Asp-tRNA(Asn)/Glu-tRNA(Gln) amidotransferase A subunit family amidase